MKGLDETITKWELAEILGQNERTIRRRAKKEGWPVNIVNNRGDQRFIVSGLPEDVRMAVMMERSRKNTTSCMSGSSLDHNILWKRGKSQGPEQAGINSDQRAVDSIYKVAKGVPERGLVENTVNIDSISSDRPLRGWQDRQALAWMDVLSLYMRNTAQKGSIRRSVGDAKRDFVLAYNNGAWPKLLEILGQTSYQTLQRKLRQLQTTDGANYTVLAPRYGSSWKKRSINQDQAQVILSVVRSPYQPKKTSEIIRISKAIMGQKGIQDGLSDSTYRRFLKDWISVNYDQWIWWREGDKGLNDKVLPWIERDYDRIDVGDVVVADGHVLNFEILNPWTGKPKRMILILWYDMKSSYPLGWEIMPTENTQAISSALRRAIIRLGKIPKVAYLDNGRAFASRFFRGVDFDETGFNGIFDKLDIKSIYAWPYHGQSKTIERFFGTFAELERMSPSYIGTSIAEKPPRLNRGEKLHRQIHEKITGGFVPTLLQAHRAIAAWFDEYARRPQRGHLAGKNPWQVFSSGQGDGVDINRLRYLMMSEDVRTIRRHGIKFLGRWYYDPELYGRKHDVTIKYDLQDPSSILVYEGDEFVCEAVPPPKVHPAAGYLGDDEDKKLLAEQIGLKRGLEKSTVSSAREFVELSVVPEVRSQIENAGFGIRRQKTEDRRQEKKVLALPLSEAEKEKIQKDFEKLDADQTRVDIWEQLPKMEDADRYEKLLEMESQAMLIMRDEQAFMRYFEETEQYMRDEDYYDDYRAKMALMYQSES